MKIRKCPVCGAYSISELCSRCNSPTSVAKPAKFSPLDPYGVYRRKMKKEFSDEENCS